MPDEPEMRCFHWRGWVLNLSIFWFWKRRPESRHPSLQAALYSGSSIFFRNSCWLVLSFASQPLKLATFPVDFLNRLSNHQLDRLLLALGFGFAKLTPTGPVFLTKKAQRKWPIYTHTMLDSLKQYLQLKYSNYSKHSMIYIYICIYIYAIYYTVILYMTGWSLARSILFPSISFNALRDFRWSHRGGAMKMTLASRMSFSLWQASHEATPPGRSMRWWRRWDMEMVLGHISLFALADLALVRGWMIRPWQSTWDASEFLKSKSSLCHWKCRSHRWPAVLLVWAGVGAQFARKLGRKDVANVGPELIVLTNVKGRSGKFTRYFALFTLFQPNHQA